MERLRVMFLCTGNSARSLIAEGLLRKLSRGRMDVFSAGTRPEAEVHPAAVDVLRTRFHVDTDGLYPKHLNQFLRQRFDYVITVCDRTAEACPTFPGDPDECDCAYRDPVERELGDQSFNWTKAHVTSDNKAFLKTLLPELRVEADGTRLLVHGSPRKMNEYLYEDRPVSSFQRIAASSNADVIVFGHTHRPYTKLVDSVLFVKAGSVGKPKDGDWRACYAFLDLKAAKSVQFVRLRYDVAVVAAAIRASALPDHFAADIERGGAPAAATK